MVLTLNSNLLNSPKIRSKYKIIRENLIYTDTNFNYTECEITLAINIKNDIR